MVANSTFTHAFKMELIDEWEKVHIYTLEMLGSKNIYLNLDKKGKKYYLNTITTFFVEKILQNHYWIAESSCRTNLNRSTLKHVIQQG